MWRVNASAFWGQTVIDGIGAVLMVVWAFKLYPNASFCTSPTDPCSCEGGGFEIYRDLCASASQDYGNNTGNTTALAKQAEKEFQGLFDALSGDTTTVFVSVGVLILVVAVFAVARGYQQWMEATAKAKELAELKEKRGASSS